MDHPLLDVLEPAERAALVSRLRVTRFRRGRVVFNDGEPGDCLYLVQCGRFDVQVTTPAGTVIVVRVIQPGEFFGELALVGPDLRRTGRVTALEASEALTLRRVEFEELRRTNPGVDRVLVAALAEQLRLATAFAAELMMPPDKRIWCRLGVLADAYGDQPIRLTQDDLARVAGTVRQTVNRVLKAGERAGVVELGHGALRVLDRDELARLAG